LASCSRWYRSFGVYVLFCFGSVCGWVFRYILFFAYLRMHGILWVL